MGRGSEGHKRSRQARERVRKWEKEERQCLTAFQHRLRGEIIEFCKYLSYSASLMNLLSCSNRIPLWIYSSIKLILQLRDKLIPWSHSFCSCLHISPYFSFMCARCSFQPQQSTQAVELSQPLSVISVGDKSNPLFHWEETEICLKFPLRLWVRLCVCWWRRIHSCSWCQTSPHLLYRT